MSLPDFSAQGELVTEPDFSSQGTLFRTGPEPTTVASDYAKSAASGILSGVGSIMQGGGEALARGINAVVPSAGARAINPFQSAIDWLESSKSEGARELQADSQFTGGVLHPENWDFGRDPSLRGLALQGLNVFGQVAPTLAVGVATAGLSTPAQLAIGAIVGGTQAFGGTLDEERDRIAQMTTKELADKSELYRTLVSRGSTPDQAKAAVGEAAAIGGGIGNAIPSAVEGSFENFLVGALTRGRVKVPGGGILGKVATGTAIGAGSGAIEETVAKMGQNIGVNMAIGTDRAIDDGTLQDFVMGAIGQGVPGGGIGAVQHLAAPRVPEKILEAGDVDEAIKQFRFSLEGNQSNGVDMEAVAKTYKDQTPEEIAANQATLIKGLQSDVGYAFDEENGHTFEGSPIEVVPAQALPVAAPEGQLTRDAYEAIAALNEAQGMKTIVYRDDGKMDEGMVNRLTSPDTYFISDKTKTDPVAVAAHEVQHLSETNEKFAAYATVVKEELTEQATELAKQRHGEMSTEKLMSEIRGDLTGDAWADPTFHGRVLTKMREQLGDAKAQDTAITFMDSILDLINRVKVVLTGTTFTTPDGQRLANQYVSNLERVHDALAAAVADQFVTKGYRPPGANTNTSQVLLQRQLALQEAKVEAENTPWTERTLAQNKLLKADWLQPPKDASPELKSAMLAAQKTPALRMADEKLNIEAVRIGVQRAPKISGANEDSAQNTGLSVAQRNNTFKYDRADLSQGYGRGQGYPQPVGTPVEKLFSNFADSLDPKKPITQEALSRFRADMLNRAQGNPAAFEKDAVSVSEIPAGDVTYKVEAAQRGGTRVTALVDGKVAAAARIKKGLIDSIATDEAFAGQDIGYGLFKFLRDEKIANVYEVPDRSPGFVQMQKRLLSEDAVQRAPRAPQTPEFKQWFGKSAARQITSSRQDFDSAPPLTLYVGRRGDFNAFEAMRETTNTTTFGQYKTRRAGIFLSESPDMASDFAEGDTGNVVPTHIRAETPLDLTNGLSEEDESRLEKSGFNVRVLRTAGVDYGFLFDEDQGGVDFVAGLRNAGYDSVVFDENRINPGDADRGGASGDPATTWVVFDPNQIKSVFNDKPTESDDISRAPNVDKAKLKAEKAKIEAARATNQGTYLNVGLSTKELRGPGTFIHQSQIAPELAKFGVNIISTKTHGSRTEPTAVVRIDRPLTVAQLDALSVALFQQAIPQLHNGSGVMAGPMASAWGPFDPAQFYMQNGKTMQKNANVFPITSKKGREVPPAIDRLAGIQSAFALAGSQMFETGRDFKVALQERLLAAAKLAGVDLSTDTPANRDYLRRAMLAEVLEGIRTNPNAIGWYDEKVTKALRILSKMHPEILTDEESKFAFIWALAVTSNGMKVDKNFQLAERAYVAWKKTGGAKGGAFALVGEGPTKKKINDGLEMYTEMKREHGFSDLKKIMFTRSRVRDIEAQTGIKPSGEALDEILFGAAILGPKIGNGFFMNLNGEFGQLTMDRWWQRMWGRLTGTLIVTNKEAVDAAKKSFTEIIGIINSDPESKELVERNLLGRRLSLSNLAELAEDIRKATSKEHVREILALVLPADKATTARIESILGKAKKGKPYRSAGDELRKAALRYWKALDGQKEAPTPPDRRMMRSIAYQVLDQIKQTHPNITMADLQAILWYPEKRVYDAAGLDETAEEGYEDSEAPDYANAAAKLARSNGITEEQIQDAIREAERDIAARNGSGRAGRGDPGVYGEPPAVEGGTAQRTPDTGGTAGAGVDGGSSSLGVERSPRQTGRLDLVGVHYSSQARQAINGQFFGTGMKGAEAARVMSSADDRIKTRVYAYVNKGPGVTPEKYVGGQAHVLQLPNLYDADADPLNIMGRNDTEFESAVLDAGFNGYLVRGPRQGVAVLLGDSARSVPAESRGTGYLGQDLPAAPEPSYTAETQLAIDVANSKELPSGQMSGADWKRVLEKMAPVLYGRLVENGAAGQIQDAETYYRDGIARLARSTASTRPADVSVSEPEVDMAVQRAPKIIGASRRKHTKEQLRMFQNVGRTVEVPTIGNRLAAIRKDFGKKLAQGLVDQFAPLKDLSKQAYTMARLSKGSSGAFEAMLKHGKIKIKDGAYDADMSGGFLDRVGIPLQGELEDFLWWVAAHRADRLTKEDREKLFSRQDIIDGKTLADGNTSFDYTIQNGIKKGMKTRVRAEIFADTLKTFDGFNKNALDMAEQSGLIDPVARKLWENEFYVPFYRVSEEDGSFVGAKMANGLVRQRAFKKLKGGTEKLNSDLLANVLANWAHLLDAGAKNRAARASLEAAVNMGVALEADAPTVKAMAASAGMKSQTVWFMDGGTQRHFVVEDPMVMAAITSLEYAGMKGPIMDALTTFKHVLTVGVTASPAFKIRNLIRDSMQAVATSPLGYNIPANIKAGIAASDPKSQTYVSALASGGLIRFGTMIEGKTSERVRQLVRMGVKDTTILDSDQKLRALYDKLIEPAVVAYNELGNRSEEINRAALFKQLKDQGMDHAEAALLARDMMDFSLQGSWTGVRFLTQVVPFMNARLQGLYKIGRSASEDPKRFAAVLGATALFSIALLAAYADDDDWKKREDWDRDNFWWFKIAGTAFRIPKPFEVGAMGTLAERGLEYFISDEMTGKRFRKVALDLVKNNLSMNPVPQFFKPMIDVYSNTDSFSGRPIESMSMENLQPDYRFTGRTSMVARAASTAGQSVTSLVGGNFVSPVQIDHMLRGYFGWLGSFVVGTADMMVRPLTNEPARPEADMWKFATQGFVSSLPEAQSRYVSHMYEQARVVEQAYGTYRALVKTGKAEEAKEFLADNRQLIGQFRTIERIKRVESQLNERIRMIERSSKTAEEKREMIERIAIQKDAVARAVR